jgi:thiamine-phosphate diphosphorylase
VSLHANKSPLPTKLPLRNKPPLLCYVTDRSLLGPRQNSCAILLEKIAQLSAAGIDWIQIREKDLSGKNCASLVEEALVGKPPVGEAIPSEGAPPLVYKGGVFCRASASANPAKIIVNDRLDVALASGAAGIHLGEESLSLPPVNKLVKARFPAESQFLIGASCHSVSAARLAEQQGAHYIFFGPVFATPSKLSFGPPQGLAALEEVSRALAIPVLAIGGISLENVSSCISAGASGIAAIRLFQNASDPAALIASLRHLFRD